MSFFNFGVCLATCYHKVVESQFRASICGLFLATPVAYFIDKAIDQDLADDSLVTEAAVSNLAVIGTIIGLDYLIELAFKKCLPQYVTKPISYLVTKELISGVIAFGVGFGVECWINALTNNSAHPQLDKESKDDPIIGAMLPLIRVLARFGIFSAFDVGFNKLKKITAGCCDPRAREIDPSAEPLLPTVATSAGLGN